MSWAILQYTFKRLLNWCKNLPSGKKTKLFKKKKKQGRGECIVGSDMAVVEIWGCSEEETPSLEPYRVISSSF